MYDLKEQLINNITCTVINNNRKGDYILKQPVIDEDLPIFKTLSRMEQKIDRNYKQLIELNEDKKDNLYISNNVISKEGDRYYVIINNYFLIRFFDLFERNMYLHKYCSYQLDTIILSVNCLDEKDFDSYTKTKDIDIYRDLKLDVTDVVLQVVDRDMLCDINICKNNKIEIYF